MAEASNIIPRTDEEEKGKSNENSSILPHWAQNLMSQAADVGTKYLAYQEYSSRVAIVDNGIGILSSADIDIGQRMTNFVDFQKANTTVLSNDCLMSRCGVPVNNIVDVTNPMSPETVENFRTNMLQGLSDLKCKMADNFMYTSAAVSVGLIVLQVCKLISVWKEIKNAENLHKDKTKFLEIEQNIKDFEEISLRLKDAVSNQQVDDIIIDTLELNEKYTETIALISSLKVKIDGIMQRLDITGNGLIYDGVSNALMAGNNIVHLIALFSSVSSPAKVAAGAIIIAFTCLVVADIATYYITQNRLEELRADFQQLHQYELQFKKMNSDIKKLLKERKRKS